MYIVYTSRYSKQLVKTNWVHLGMSGYHFFLISYHGYHGYLNIMDTWIGGYRGYLDIMDTWIVRYHGLHSYISWIVG